MCSWIVDGLGIKKLRSLFIGSLLTQLNGPSASWEFPVFIVPEDCYWVFWSTVIQSVPSHPLCLWDLFFVVEILGLYGGDYEHCLWGVVLCNLVNRYQYFRGTCYLHPEGSHRWRQQTRTW